MFGVGNRKTYILIGLVVLLLFFFSTATLTVSSSSNGNNVAKKTSQKKTTKTNNETAQTQHKNAAAKLSTDFDKYGFMIPAKDFKNDDLLQVKNSYRRAVLFYKNDLYFVKPLLK